MYSHVHTLERSRRNRFLFVTFTYMLKHKEGLLLQQIRAVLGPRDSEMETPDMLVRHVLFTANLTVQLTVYFLSFI